MVNASSFILRSSSLCLRALPKWGMIDLQAEACCCDRLIKRGGMEHAEAGPSTPLVIFQDMAVEAFTALFDARSAAK